MITRKVFQPKDIHLLVAERLTSEGLWSKGLVIWRSVREQAERLARAKTAAEEVTFVQIYLEMESTVGGQAAARGGALELETELSSCMGIGTTIAAIQRLKNAGERVVYASDMYLPKEHVLLMLEKAGAPQAPLYLSSDIGKTKRTGSLFRHMAQQNGVSMGDIRHVGDHREADDRVPRRMGVQARLYSGGRPTLLEADIFRRLETKSPLLATTWVGSMRAARLALPTEPIPSQPSSQRLLYQMGTQQGALVHLGFVLWLLPRLCELRPNKLSFLARDGYLAAKLFDVLRSQVATELPASSYTYASRQSLHLAGLSLPLREEDMAWILSPTDSLTFAGWLFRLALRADDLVGLESQTTIPRPETEFLECKQQCVRLLELPGFLELVANRARTARLLAREYLEPRILSAAGTSAIVDIGWNGRMQRSIVSVIEPSAAQIEAVHGYYLGILRVPVGSYGSYTAWLFDLRTESRPYCASHFQLFETLFAAPHATTYGYQRETDGSVVPRLADHDVMRSIWPALIGFQEVVLEIAGSIHLDWNELRDAEQSIRALCRQSLTSLFRAPNRAEALAFFDVGFSSDQSSEGKERLIVQLSWPQQYSFMFGMRRQFSNNHWTEGQMAIADAPLLPSIYRLRSALRLLLKKQVGWRDILRQLSWHLKGLRA